MRFRNSAILVVAIFLFSTFSAFAQESEAVVIDEVVAQVNDGVLTLSRIKRELKETADSMVAQQGKTPEAAKAEVESRKGEIIAGLINEELLVQKGKEAGVDTEVTNEVNRRFLDLMKSNNLKTVEALYAEMRKANVNPDDLRELWSKQIAKESVLKNEVDRKIYFGLTSAELKKYYEEHKSEFSKQETVTLSEIYLNYAGRDEAAVKEKAKQLVAQIRAGGDFEKIAVENSDRQDAATNKGKVGKFPANELNEQLAAPVKATKAGSVTDPIEVEGGIEIVRVDERDDASAESVFNEDQVRLAMTYKKVPDERKKFMTELRKDAYIKISDSYRAIVTPFLYKDDNATAEVKKADAKTPQVKKNEK